MPGTFQQKKHERVSKTGKVFWAGTAVAGTAVGAFGAAGIARLAKKLARQRKPVIGRKAKGSVKQVSRGFKVYGSKPELKARIAKVLGEADARRANTKAQYTRSKAIVQRVLGGNYG